MWVYLGFPFKNELVAQRFAAELHGKAVKLRSGRYVVRCEATVL